MLESSKRYLVKEQMLKRDLRKKEACLKQRSRSLLRSYLSYLKIKGFEDIVSKVVVTEQTTPESQIHIPRNDSADFKKTAATSNQKIVFTRRSVKSFDQIRTTSIFFDENVDGSDTYKRRRRRRRYKEEELVWKVKPVKEEKKDEKKGKKICVH
ncbi:hypothetical protein L6452_44277 [Arctium lappa]|uniref:Uncharacterized protein n=1 Tax=Arctium lappa TaxID=4217 RepID=A0ACB8XFZ4_ARCLA|nr:hypothetical protein L6452_44277 [Arctium lappa]